MLSKISINNFKSIKEMTLELNNFNLLVGTNSSGKSSFIQSLLLLHQNYINNRCCGLNGPFISLGGVDEVLNYSVKRGFDSISFTAEDLYNTYELKFTPEDDEYGKTKYNTSLNNSIYNKTLKYLSCHRIGALNLYQKNYENQEDIGIDGQFAISYLSNEGGYDIESDLLVCNPELHLTNDLKTQTNYWLQKIVSTKITVDEIEGTDCVRAKYLSITSDEGMEKYTRPIHVGSGISYLISIIVTCLSSKKDDIIVIENPEIHLHPKAQAQLCDFLYHIAKADRQLLVETHSDHIFDGVRAGTATGEMDPLKISIDFFRKDKNSNTEVVPIIIESKGRIRAENPDDDLTDLFDQFDINLDRMLGM